MEAFKKPHKITEVWNQAKPLGVVRLRNSLKEVI